MVLIRPTTSVMRFFPRVCRIVEAVGIKTLWKAVARTNRYLGRTFHWGHRYVLLAVLSGWFYSTLPPGSFVSSTLVREAPSLRQRQVLIDGLNKDFSARSSMLAQTDERWHKVSMRVIDVLPVQPDEIEIVVDCVAFSLMSIEPVPVLEESSLRFRWDPKKPHPAWAPTVSITWSPSVVGSCSDGFGRLARPSSPDEPFPINLQSVNTRMIDGTEFLAIQRGDPYYSPDRLRRMMYFSAVTITTLGFGDITPISPSARLFVALEAMLGVGFAGLYLARVADRSFSKTRPQP